MSPFDDDDEHLAGFDEEGDWRPAPGLLLHHGTSSTMLASIKAHGMRSDSHWGSRRVAEYFAQANCRHHQGSPIILSVRLDALDVRHLRQDDGMIEFPIFPDYDRRQCLWEEADYPGWQLCLQLYEAVVSGAPIPWHMIHQNR